MALTGPQQASIATLITQEGGLQNFVTEVQALYIANKKTTDLAALGADISVTVQSWPSITAYVASASNIALYSVMADIATATGNQDASKLGPLMVALYAAVKANLGL